jgi:RNA polymerase sigma-70 factor, ECF subfamily
LFLLKASVRSNPLQSLLRIEAKWVSCDAILAYLQIVDAAPIRPVEDAVSSQNSFATTAVSRELLNQFWNECDASTWGLRQDEFDRILEQAAKVQNFGQPQGTPTGTAIQAQFFRALKLSDLVLAKACSAGNERAWERFMAIYAQALTRAAIAISGSETVGRDLADSFYAELYGLSARDGQRRCPLDSYRGRGSLLAWLRTTLAQRFVDHYRRTYREQALDEEVHDAPAPLTTRDPEPATLVSLRGSLHTALQHQPAEERFLLATYYVDEKTLAEIGRLLHVHEATVSRRLKRAADAIRKQLLHNLESKGMSRKAAEEALGIDPRDLDLQMDLRKLLQYPPVDPIQDQSAWKQEMVHSASTQLPSEKAALTVDKATAE